MVCCSRTEIWRKDTVLEEQILADDMRANKSAHTSFQCENRKGINMGPKKHQPEKDGSQTVSLKRDQEEVAREGGLRPSHVDVREPQRGGQMLL